MKRAVVLLIAFALVASCGEESSKAKAPAPPPVTDTFPRTVIPPGAEQTQCVAAH